MEGQDSAVECCYLKLHFNEFPECKLFERNQKDKENEGMEVDTPQQPQAPKNDSHKSKLPGYKCGLNLLIHEATKDKQSLRRFIMQVTSVDPIQIDVFKPQSKIVLKFRSVEETDVCSNRLIQAKFSTSSHQSKQAHSKMSGSKSPGASKSRGGSGKGSQAKKQMISEKQDVPSAIEYSLKNKEHCSQLVPILINKIDSLDSDEMKAYEKLV